MARVFRKTLRCRAFSCMFVHFRTFSCIVVHFRDFPWIVVILVHFLIFASQLSPGFEIAREFQERSR